MKGRYLLLLSLAAVFLLPAWLWPQGLWLTLLAESILIWLLINLTDIGFRPQAYQEPDNIPLMDERAAGVYQQRGNAVGKNSKAVLLIHGFSSNPWLYHKHIPLFQAAGYDVIAPRLPGHGTCGEEFVKTGFADYYRCVEQHLQRYRPQYQQFHVVGISMGGLLTLNLASDYSGSELAPSSITTLAAPCRMNSPLLAMVRVLSWFKPTLKGSWDPNSRESDGGEQWLGYHDLFLPQAYSLAVAMVRVRAKLKQITVPHLLVHARGDIDVPFANLWEIAGSTSSGTQSVWVPDLSQFDHSQHALLLYDSLVTPLSGRIVDFWQQTEAFPETQTPEPGQKQSEEKAADQAVSAA